MERMVFAVSVKTRHAFADGMSWARNVLGKNLPAYENMISAAIKEATERLYEKYPDAYDLKIHTVNTTQGAAEVIVYGKVNNNA